MWPTHGLLFVLLCILQPHPTAAGGRRVQLLQDLWHVRRRPLCPNIDEDPTPESFAIDAKKVEQLYWSLQKKMHPDLYGSKSEVEKELSVVNSALVNQAYNLLKAPTSRANYLVRLCHILDEVPHPLRLGQLHLHGIDALGDTTTFVDPATLMAIMEAREEIEECTSMDELDRHKAHNANQIEACMQKLAEAFDSNQDFDTSKQLTVELQYLVKLSEAILDKQDHLDQ
ncbi:hypothetical protein AaE_011337 [Aphanomyces astaci]|uniref:Co-chaperone HscB C-terminal oligomerisation domain-containing protein n=1 Tax=Aphanomyces astaci TaxID=112090 RepID=A0A6A4ZZJ4_APHAT|nr:hypothetical protein AaE_011337 [Aphanomyces astaci]